MGCRKLTNYEKRATLLRMLPDNDEITVVVVYSIRYNNEKVVQGWWLLDPAEQFANPYLAMGNNPVMYVDPDGEFIFAAVGIGILANALITGAVIGAASYTVSVALSPGGFENWNGGEFAKSIGIGALSGALTAGIGSAFGGVGGTGSALGNIVKEATRAGFHGMSSVVTNTVFGNDVNAGTFAIGAFSSITGSLTPNWSTGGQIGLSAATGGVTAELTGGNFWAGAANGAIVGGLNHTMHAVTKEANWQYIQKHATEKGSRQQLINEMMGESVETHGADVTDGGTEKYYMLDNTGNTKTRSLWDASQLPRRVDVIRRYHTHPANGVPSWEDSFSAYWYRPGRRVVPSYAITSTIVYRINPVPIPGQTGPYGNKVANTSDWLNGIWNGL